MTICSDVVSLNVFFKASATSKYANLLSSAYFTIASKFIDCPAGASALIPLTISSWVFVFIAWSSAEFNVVPSIPIFFTMDSISDLDDPFCTSFVIGSCNTFDIAVV